VKYRGDAKETALLLKEKEKWVTCWMTVLAIAIGKRVIPVKKERRFILLISRSKLHKGSQISRIRVENLGTLL
jgi:hypothetical protein